MTLQEFTAQVIADLKAAGFDPTEYQGFPIVKPNLEEGMTAHLERVRLLKFKPSIPCDKRIYAEGMIFLPSGANLAIREAEKNATD